MSFKTELLSEYLIQKGYLLMGELLGIGFSFKNRKNVDNDVYGVKKEYEEFEKIVKDDYKRLLPGFFKIIEELSTRFISFGDKLINKNLQELSNKELASLFDDFCTTYEKVVGLIGVPKPCENVMKSVLRERTRDYLRSKKTSFEEFLITISFPNKETRTFQERIDLLKLAVKMNKGEDISKAVEEHSKKYAWITRTLFLGDDYTPEKVIEEIKKEARKSPEKQIVKINKDRALEMRQFEQLLSEVPEIVKEEIRLYQELIFFRTARLEWLNEGCYKAKRLLKEIGQRLGLSTKELIYLTPYEIKEWLIKGRTVDKRSIQERIEQYALVMEDGEITLYTGEGVDKQREERETNNTEELVGICASPGVAVGKVKIVKDRSELDKIEEGDIMVARLTTPDFVGAMRKAAAIITDIGGLTSHAAITSRELRIPCIVSVKTATRLLKDKELVEVNATKGVIKRVNNRR